MMKRAIFPARYVQGPNALSCFGSEVSRIGERILVLGDATLPDDVFKGIDASGITMELARVAPDCSDRAIAAIVEQAKSLGVEAIAGMGGGKVIDLARASAAILEIPMISVPSSAASDAPCSALAVVYDENGHVVRDQFVKWNPSIVIVDTNVIAKAPARLLAAGMGDGLATYYEAMACFRSGAPNMVKSSQTRLAMTVAELCRDTILQYGVEAMKQCRTKTPGEAFEAIVEANILLSGVGFESGGVAAAHAIHHGLAELEETHDKLHGEKVAFGVLVELALNDVPDDEIGEIINFCRAVGLPVTLADLGITDVEAALPIVITRATRLGEIIYNEPVEITPKKVREAILRADQLGQTLRPSI